MRPLTLPLPEHSLAALQHEVNRHQAARHDHRLHSVSLVASGMSFERAAGLFGDSPRTVVNWVPHFDQKGLAGLAEGNHSGRPARLSVEQLEEVHFCPHGSRCRMWVPWEEADPVLWHYPGRKSIGFFGAVRLRAGKGGFRQEPGMFDGTTLGEFMRQLQIQPHRGTASRSDYRQRQIPPRQTSCRVAHGASKPVCPGFSAALQP